MNKGLKGHTQLLLHLTRSVLRYNPHLLVAPYAIWMAEEIAPHAHKGTTNSVRCIYGPRQQKRVKERHDET